MPIPDELLDRLGDFYASDFVKANMPWVREIPFEKWLERQIVKGGEHSAHPRKGIQHEAHYTNQLTATRHNHEVCQSAKNLHESIVRKKKENSRRAGRLIR